MKSLWNVQIPITGHLEYTVTADSEAAAFEAAWDRYADGDHGDDEPFWEAVESVGTGNVCHAELSKQSAQKARS